jgi:hypothetical protein
MQQCNARSVCIAHDVKVLQLSLAGYWLVLGIVHRPWPLSNGNITRQPRHIAHFRARLVFSLAHRIAQVISYVLTATARSAQRSNVPRDRAHRQRTS